MFGKSLAMKSNATEFAKQNATLNGGIFRNKKK